MHCTTFSGPLTILLLAGVLAGQDPIPKPSPEQALAKSLQRSKTHNTRVLVLLHREGDEDSQDAVTALSKGRRLARQVRYEYELLPLDATAAPKLLEQWQVEADAAVPALLVLSPDGAVVARAARDAFVDDSGIDTTRLGAILTEHQVEPVDAEQKLRAALVEAEKTGRSVFVRFDAPW